MAVGLKKCHCHCYQASGCTFRPTAMVVRTSSPGQGAAKGCDLWVCSATSHVLEAPSKTPPKLPQSLKYLFLDYVCKNTSPAADCPKWTMRSPDPWRCSPSSCRTCKSTKKIAAMCKIVVVLGDLPYCWGSELQIHPS